MEKVTLNMPKAARSRGGDDHNQPAMSSRFLCRLLRERIAQSLSFEESTVTQNSPGIAQPEIKGWEGKSPTNTEFTNTSKLLILILAVTSSENIGFFLPTVLFLSLEVPYRPMYSLDDGILLIQVFLIHPAISCIFPMHLTLNKCLILDCVDKLRPVSLRDEEEKCCQSDRICNFYEKIMKIKSFKELQKIISVFR